MYVASACRPVPGRVIVSRFTRPPASSYIPSIRSAYGTLSTSSRKETRGVTLDVCCRAGRWRPARAPISHPSIGVSFSKPTSPRSKPSGISSRHCPSYGPHLTVKMQGICLSFFYQCGSEYEFRERGRERGRERSRCEVSHKFLIDSDASTLDLTISESENNVHGYIMNVFKRPLK